MTDENKEFETSATGLSEDEAVKRIENVVSLLKLEIYSGIARAQKFKDERDVYACE